jgi:hypothetical protein
MSGNRKRRKRASRIKPASGGAISNTGKQPPTAALAPVIESRRDDLDERRSRLQFEYTNRYALKAVILSIVNVGPYALGYIFKFLGIGISLALIPCAAFHGMRLYVWWEVNRLTKHQADLSPATAERKWRTLCSLDRIQNVLFLPVVVVIVITCVAIVRIPYAGSTWSVPLPCFVYDGLNLQPPGNRLAQCGTDPKAMISFDADQCEWRDDDSLRLPVLVCSPHLNAQTTVAMTVPVVLRDRTLRIVSDDGVASSVDGRRVILDFTDVFASRDATAWDYRFRIERPNRRPELQFVVRLTLGGISALRPLDTRLDNIFDDATQLRLKHEFPLTDRYLEVLTRLYDAYLPGRRLDERYVKAVYYRAIMKLALYTEEHIEPTRPSADVARLPEQVIGLLESLDGWLRRAKDESLPYATRLSTLTSVLKVDVALRMQTSAPYLRTMLKDLLKDPTFRCDDHIQRIRFYSAIVAFADAVDPARTMKSVGDLARDILRGPPDASCGEDKANGFKALYFHEGKIQAGQSTFTSSVVACALALRADPSGALFGDLECERDNYDDVTSLLNYFVLHMKQRLAGEPWFVDDRSFVDVSASVEPPP